MTAIHEHYWLVHSDFFDTSGDYEPALDTKGRPKGAFCKCCRRVLDSWYPRHLEGWLRRNYHALLLPLSNAPMIHADIWRQLAVHCPSAVTGPVMVQEGDIDRFTLDWVTVLFPPSEIVHASGAPDPNPGRGRSLAPWPCEVCGQEHYFNMFRDMHLVRSRVPEGKSVFWERHNYLIVAEPLAETIDWSGYPDFRYERMPVLDRPLDGIRLRGDPDWSATGE